MRVIPLVVLTSFLAGCLATTDLLSSASVLSPEHRRVAQNMSDNAKRSCITYSYVGTPDNKISGDMKVYGAAPIRRFFSSNTGWFKAMTSINGVTDNIYYNPSTFQFLCGDQSWGKINEASGIRFIEAGSSESLQTVNSVSRTPAPRGIMPMEDQLKVWKELFQKGLITETQYNQQVDKLLSK